MAPRIPDVDAQAEKVIDAAGAVLDNTPPAELADVLERAAELVRSRLPDAVSVDGDEQGTPETGETD